MKNPEISVVIPVRNQAGKIGRCLEAVFAQSLPPAEVIIVDGRSTDETVETARKYPVKVCYQDYGAAGAARQIGAENARGEFIAFTDADCIPDSNWLQTLVAEITDEVIAVGGGMLNIGEGLWNNSINLVFSSFLGNANQLQAARFKEKKAVRELGLFNAIYRKKDILEVGGFNVDLLGADETELNRRLSRAGKKMLYTPDTVVRHDHGRGLREFARNMYRYGTWRRQSRVWDLPVVPPLLVPLLLLSLFFTRRVFFPIIALYLFSLAAMGLKFAVQEKDARYAFTIPVVYLIEHTAYIIGFWKEVFKPARRSRGRGEGKR